MALRLERSDDACFLRFLKAFLDLGQVCSDAFGPGSHLDERRFDLR